MLWQWGCTASLVCQTHSPAGKQRAEEMVKQQEKHSTMGTAVHCIFCLVKI